MRYKKRVPLRPDERSRKLAARTIRGEDVVIVEDDAGTRALLSDVLERAGFSTVAVETGEEALALVGSRALPALVVLDVRLPGLSGYEVCAELRDRYADALAIIFLSGERIEPFDIATGLRLGADDYLLKPFAPEELIARVRRIGQQRSARAGSALSPRELEILTMLTEGLKQREIARQLSLSPKTVASHIHNLLGKLDARSPAQAAAEAVRRGMLATAASGSGAGGAAVRTSR